MIYALALKTYEADSSRRVCGEIKIVSQAKFIKQAFHFNTLLKYLGDPNLKPLLKELIEISALPLKEVESDFAVDATGFSTSVFGRWFNSRTRKEETRRWRKAHCICGVKTNIITSVEITPGYCNDSPYLPSLVERTADNFSMKEVSADKGYISKSNLKAIKNLGAIPFIPFKSNTSGKRKGALIWRECFEYFRENKEEFLKHYHKRSNIESCFSMIKKKLGSNIRSVQPAGQDNEILLKILVHNIMVLIQESFMSDLKIDFQKCADDYIAH